MEKEKKRSFSVSKFLYWLIFAVVLMVIYKLIDNASGLTNGLKRFVSVITPFILGGIIAYLFYFPCRGIENLYKKVKFLRKHARGLSIITVYLITLGLIILLINVLFPALSESVVELANNLPGYYKSAVEFINNMPDNSLINKEDVKNIINNLQQTDIVEIFSFENMINYIKGMMGIASMIFNIFVMVIMSVYLLLEREKILNFIQRFNKAIFKKQSGDRANEYIIKANNVFLRFISSQILDGIIVGIIVSIVLAIMKVKYAVLLGFLIGLSNIIPYFGAIIGVAISVIITIFTGGLSQAIWMLIVITILQQIDANVINPKIVGNALKISPILIIFSVTVAGAYFGVLGMFLVVPIVAIIKILVNDYIEYKLETKKQYKE